MISTITDAAYGEYDDEEDDDEEELDESDFWDGEEDYEPVEGDEAHKIDMACDCPVCVEWRRKELGIG